ncbi:ABC transporter permease [Pseudoroseicyclus sp. CXY001]|uniref:ABC transporter permease n=1 Tax=Pseudoroseicyclus sp. CXY001 TaxID=3242492 RepID=UPI003570D0A9
MTDTLTRILRDYAALIILIVLAVTLSIVSPNFLRPQNFLNILNQNAPLLIIAVALTPVIIAGGFDISTASILAVAGCSAAWLAAAGHPYLGIVLAPFIGLALGIVNGLIITGFRVHAFLATIATGMVFRGIAVRITDGQLISARMEEFSWLGRGRIFDTVHIAVLVMIVCVAIIAFLLNRTAYGRYVFAVGGNEEAALLSGLPNRIVRIATFAGVGMAAGIAGAITVSRTGQGQPLVGEGLEFDAIAAVILGGTSVFGGEGAIWRTVVGVLLLALINNGFNLLNVDPFVKDITTGSVIILAIALGAANRSR